MTRTALAQAARRAPSRTPPSPESVRRGYSRVRSGVVRGGTQGEIAGYSWSTHRELGAPQEMLTDPSPPSGRGIAVRFVSAAARSDSAVRALLALPHSRVRVCLFAPTAALVCVCLFVCPTAVGVGVTLMSAYVESRRCSSGSRARYLRRAGTHGVLTGYSRGTHGVLTGYSRGTHGVLTGYSKRAGQPVRHSGSRAR
jgi:hypothetical protein